MDKIRFGIIGVAGRGSSYLGTLQAHAATEITALCDIRAEEMRQHAADLGVEHAFTDAGEMIDAGGVDAVGVGTPMPFHAFQAITNSSRLSKPPGLPGASMIDRNCSRESPPRLVIWSR